MAEAAKEATTEKLMCAYCGDEITDKPIRKWGKVYCSEACAYEGGRSKGCQALVLSQGRGKEAVI